MTDRVHLHRLSGEHADDLVALFARIAADATAAAFHPHAFTADAARTIATGCGRDIYLGLWVADVLQGYGLLRGWDAGFEVPSLGIYLTPPARGRGLGEALMLALQDHARKAGAKQIRLKVYPSNAGAVALYARLGYRFIGEENGQRIAIVDLQTPGWPRST